MRILSDCAALLIRLSRISSNSNSHFWKTNSWNLHSAQERKFFVKERRDFFFNFAQNSLPKWLRNRQNTLCFSNSRHNPKRKKCQQNFTNSFFNSSTYLPGETGRGIGQVGTRNRDLGIRGYIAGALKTSNVTSFKRKPSLKPWALSGWRIWPFCREDAVRQDAFCCCPRIKKTLSAIIRLLN